MTENNGVSVITPTTTLNMFANQESFSTGFKMSQALASSTIVPKAFQSNVGNTMIAIDLALRMHTNPLMIMQNIYVVNGQPGFSARFLIACINASGLFASSLRYEFVGEEGKDNWGCRAYAIDKQGEVLKGSLITIDIAKRKGWYDRQGSNWKAEPEQMLRYRAATRFQSAYCPEILCGVAVKEELEDMDYTEVTDNNIEQLSAEEKLAHAQLKEQKEANSQSMGMNTGTATTDAPVSVSKPEGNKPITPETSSKIQPIGKQKMPDMFNLS
jgi:hypothetical protein